ncbi:hypothetical protein U9M48_031247, partial [Paspalum notatum var. saurae]
MRSPKRQRPESFTRSHRVTPNSKPQSNTSKNTTSLDVGSSIPNQYKSPESIDSPFGANIIGQLTVIHPVVHSSSLNGPSVRRELELRDLSLSVTLWGEHATSFEDEFLIQTIGSDEPIVIIFTRMQGRGSEAQILPGDADAETGGVDEENANRKTVSELLSLNPHDNNDVRFTCHATIREIDVTIGWWYKVCSNCKKGLKATLQGSFDYKLDVAIEDATGRAKIFMFGGVAEQVVRQTASELVEESSSNQILLPAALQAVISEQTFRTSVLCFQARRVFMPLRVEQSRASNVYLQDNPNKGFTTPAGIGSSSTTPNKEPADGSSTLTQNSMDFFGEESTPPPIPDTSTPIKHSCTKGKEVPSGTHEEH